MLHVRLSRLLGRRRPVLLVLAGLGVAIGATYVAQALVTAELFGRIVGGTADDARLSVVGGWLLALGALLVVRPVLALVREVVSTALMTRTKADLRDEVVTRTILDSAVDAGRGRTGRDHATAVDGIENLDAYLGRYLPQLLTCVVVSLAVVVALATIDPVVAVVLAVAATAVPLLPRLWDRVLARRGADHWDAYQDLHAEFVDSMQGMTTLVLHDAADRRQARLAAASELLLDRTLRQLRLSLLESGISTLALSAVPLLALTLVVARRDGLTTVDCFAIVLLAVELVRPLRDLATHWHAGYLGTFSGQQVLEIVDRPRDVSARVDAPQKVGRIDVRGLGFRHLGAESDTLVDLDARFDRGATVVLGPSGGGKSTLVGLVAGLADPGGGTIELDGRPVDAATLRSAVALAPQDPVLFTGTVRDNLELGRPVDGRPGLALDRAAALAGIGTVDPTLTLDTPVGERGALVSGGQRQRIAIARALMQDRAVLVLDEATSSLDAGSERTLLAALVAEWPERILVVVTHRVDTAAQADAVVVVRAGRAAEPEAVR